MIQQVSSGARPSLLLCVTRLCSKGPICIQLLSGFLFGASNCPLVLEGSIREPRPLLNGGCGICGSIEMEKAAASSGTSDCSGGFSGALKAAVTTAQPGGTVGTRGAECGPAEAALSPRAPGPCPSVRPSEGPAPQNTSSLRVPRAGEGTGLRLDAGREVCCHQEHS